MFERHPNNLPNNNLEKSTPLEVGLESQLFESKSADRVRHTLSSAGEGSQLLIKVAALIFKDKIIISSPTDAYQTLGLSSLNLGLTAEQWKVAAEGGGLDAETFNLVIKKLITCVRSNLELNPNASERQDALIALNSFNWALLKQRPEVLPLTFHASSTLKQSSQANDGQASDSIHESTCNGELVNQVGPKGSVISAEAPTIDPVVLDFSRTLLLIFVAEMIFGYRMTIESPQDAFDALASLELGISAEQFSAVAQGASLEEKFEELKEQLINEIRNRIDAERTLRIKQSRLAVLKLLSWDILQGGTPPIAVIDAEHLTTDQSKPASPGKLPSTQQTTASSINSTLTEKSNDTISYAVEHLGLEKSLLPASSNQPEAPSKKQRKKSSSTVTKAKYRAWKSNVQPEIPPSDKGQAAKPKTVFEAIVKYGHDEDFNPVVDFTFMPTDAPAGSAEKIEILRKRIELGQPLFHEYDRVDYNGLTGAIRPRE